MHRAHLKESASRVNTILLLSACARERTDPPEWTFRGLVPHAHKNDKHHSTGILLTYVCNNGEISDRLH